MDGSQSITYKRVHDIFKYDDERGGDYSVLHLEVGILHASNHLLSVPEGEILVLNNREPFSLPEVVPLLRVPNGDREQYQDYWEHACEKDSEEKCGKII